MDQSDLAFKAFACLLGTLGAEPIERGTVQLPCIGISEVDARVAAQPAAGFCKAEALSAGSRAVWVSPKAQATLVVAGGDLIVRRYTTDAEFGAALAELERLYA